MFAFLRHLFLPHHTNNHRPKVLHHQFLFILLAFLCVAGVAGSFVKQEYPSVLSISTNISVQELLDLTNKEREQKGLQPLRLNEQLSGAAMLKADHMFTHNYWSHISPDGTTPWAFIRSNGYEYLYAGENLARGFTTAPDVISAWMKSPSHRENMLSSNYDEVGFAIQSGKLTGSETVLVVEMFGTRYTKDIPSTLSNTFPAPSTIPVVTFEQSVAPRGVASLQNDPLVDSKATSRNIALLLVIVFISVLILDAIIVERRNISRLVAHNLDHIIFLTALLIAAILIGEGIVL